MPVDHAVDGTVVSDANDSHGGMRAVDIRGEGGGALVTPLVKDMCCLKTSKYLCQTSRNLDKTFGNPCAGHVIPTLGECILELIPGS